MVVRFFHDVVVTENVKALADSKSLPTPCVCVSLRVAPEPTASALPVVDLSKNTFSGLALDSLINLWKEITDFALLTSSSDDSYIHEFHYFCLTHYIKMLTNKRI